MRKGIPGTTPVKKVFTGPTEEDYKEMNKKVGLNNVKISQPLVLRISEWCHSHIRNLHIEYPHKEWLAICKTQQVEPGVFEIIDMIHPEQTATSGSVTATDKGMDWSVDYLMEKGEDLSKWNLILHSHHSMGVFWSGTDDNARLGYNDGRFMCWAVVTAYSGSPESGAISYKGCVNFYKPYNIEIDCEVQQPERDLRVELEEYLDTDEKYKKTLKENKKKILEELIEQSIDKINELSDNADYSRIIEYLGIDITQELVENYKVVSQKIPNPQVEDFLKELETQAEEKAQEETPQEEKEIPHELEEFMNWSIGLEDQLATAFKTGEATQTRFYNWTDYSKKYETNRTFPMVSEPQEKSLFPSADLYADPYDEDSDEWTLYDRWHIATAQELAQELNIDLRLNPVALDKEGRRTIYSRVMQQYMLVDDFLEQVADYELYNEGY